MAQQIEIANAYIALTTKMPGVKKDIASALGGASSSVEKSGGKLGSSLMNGMKRTAVVGATAVGAAAAAGIGTAMVKGFQRLKGIDDATAKMEGLGFSAQETEGLMDNALTSVKGTAFGLDEAATVASQLAATGIGPGDEMATILSTIANNAAAAGGSMDEMGSIFSKAATQANGVQNDVISQLADKGIPIYQALAEELGVTAGEVFDLASAGEIGFDQFAKAAESASGGVAEAMGGTVTGSWNNLMASLGRVGAGALGGLFAGLAPAIQGFTSALGPVEDIAADVGESIGKFLAPALDFLANLGDSGFDFSAFGQLATMMSPLSIAFQAIAPVLPQIATAFNEIVTVLGGAFSEILAALMPTLTELVAVFVQVAAEVIPALLPVLTTVAEVFGSILTAIAPILPLIGELVTLLLPPLVEGMMTFIPVIEGVVNAIGTLLVPIIEMLEDVLGGIVTFLTGVFTGDWEKAWSGLVQIFSGIWNGMIGIVEGTVNGIVDLINGLIGGINNISGKVGIPAIPLIPHADFSAAMLAEGGIVQQSQGGTLAVIGEGRYDEAVIPLSPQVLSQLGGGGGGPRVQMEIHPAEGMSEETIGRVAADRVNYMLRGA